MTRTRSQSTRHQLTNELGVTSSKKKRAPQREVAKQALKRVKLYAAAEEDEDDDDESGKEEFFERIVVRATEVVLKEQMISLRMEKTKPLSKHEKLKALISEIMDEKLKPVLAKLDDDDDTDEEEERYTLAFKRAINTDLIKRLFREALTIEGQDDDENVGTSTSSRKQHRTEDDAMDSKKDISDFIHKPATPIQRDLFDESKWYLPDPEGEKKLNDFIKKPWTKEVHGSDEVHTRLMTAVQGWIRDVDQQN